MHPASQEPCFLRLARAQKHHPRGLARVQKHPRGRGQGAARGLAGGGHTFPPRVGVPPGYYLTMAVLF